ncbi:unnamed protein product [Symbiodinium sp. CCMP2592]|nr:unnamed protein product [Symbiodinium sp. CCMP2592]CAE7042054.1 unnamed protein product [Symbiodinium sp. CCMP2592]
MKRPIFTGPGSLKRQKKPEPADGASQSTRAPPSHDATLGFEQSPRPWFQENNDNSEVNCKAVQQARAEPPVPRPIEDSLENVIEGIKTGKLAALAKTMRDEIGIKDSAWESMAPRNAVQAFLGRYTHARNPEYDLQHIARDNGDVLVRLRTPAFFGRHYEVEGNEPRDACAAFKYDPEVDKARRKLLPPLQKIRQHCMLSKAQKEELRKRGFDAEDVQNDVYMLVYSGFRPLGCCTAFWDGNVSKPPMIFKKPE